MSLISSGKYKTSAEFYESRFVRIFAPYYITLVFFAILSLLSGFLFNKWGIFQAITNQHIESVGLFPFLLSILPNFTILGSDLLFFLNGSTNTLSFTANFHDSSNPLYLGLFMPQCWSVSLELMFYLLTTILCSLKSFKLLLILISSLILRISFYETTSLTNDPWSYRFVVFEIFFFVAGIILHRLAFFPISKYKINLKQPFALPIIYTVVLILGFLSFKFYWHLFKYLGANYSDIISILAFSPFIGLLFLFTKDNHFDRWIGELSYPVYLNHLILGSFIKALLPEYLFSLIGPMTAIVSILFAAIFHFYFFSSIDRWRYSKFVPHTS